MQTIKILYLFLILCHRVIGASGKLVGYRGGLKVKEYLLNLEKKFVAK